MGGLPGPFAAAGLSYCTASKGNPKYQQHPMGWLVFLLRFWAVYCCQEESELCGHLRG